MSVCPGPVFFMFPAFLLSAVLIDLMVLLLLQLHVPDWPRCLPLRLLVLRVCVLRHGLHHRERRRGGAVRAGRLLRLQHRHLRPGLPGGGPLGLDPGRLARRQWLLRLRGLWRGAPPGRGLRAHGRRVPRAQDREVRHPGPPRRAEHCRPLGVSRRTRGLHPHVRLPRVQRRH